MVTAHGHPDLVLQMAGHGSLVQTQTGEWYLAHLIARPYTPLGRCVLGRETAVQRVEWSQDGWPRVPGGIPHERVGAPRLPQSPFPEEAARDEFDALVLGPRWSTLRRAAEAGWLDLRARPSHLRVFGGQSPHGPHTPSLVARRLTHRYCSLETVVDCRPQSFQHLAGITAYYNSRNWHYFYVTRTHEGGVQLQPLTEDARRLTAQRSGVVDLDPGMTRIRLRVELEEERAMFSYDVGRGWQTVPVVLDATILSDEYAAHAGVVADRDHPGFTGAFLGLWVMDPAADGFFADFDYARYDAGIR